MEEREMRITVQGGSLYINKDDLIFNLSIKSQRIEGLEARTFLLSIISYLALIQAKPT